MKRKFISQFPVSRFLLSAVTSGLCFLLLDFPFHRFSFQFFPPVF